jgi:ubiquinone/menaquinone biosynthesis C-methylase UbiE
MKKQVTRSHYNFADYMRKKRWISVWHQLDEVAKLQPDSVLEIGPGTGLFKQAAACFGISVQTVDIDPELAPDYVSPATSLSLDDASVDVACAFQVLEHMPFEDSMKSLAEMFRVARKAVVISLPDAKTRWPVSITIPRIGRRDFFIPRPLYRPPEHRFNGQHYWEISKRHYSLDFVSNQMEKISVGLDMRTFLVPENPYHRFFVFNKKY